MSGFIGAAGKRLVKGAFRKMGMDLRRHVPITAQVSEEPNRPVVVNKLCISSPIGPSMPLRPAPFILVATNHGTLIVNRNDYHQEGQSPRFGVGFELFETSCFESEEVRLALALLSKRKESHGSGVVAIDCGANIGVHTVEWARHMHGWGRVIAIEAQERIYYSLCGNISINNCLNAKALLAAAGTKHGRMRVPVPDYCRDRKSVV